MAVTKKIENGKVVYRLNGTKLYPICKWEDNQHKIYNAYDRALNYCYETNYSEDAQRVLELAQKKMEIIDRYIFGGIVYGTWEEYKLVQDSIWAYNARH